MKKRKDYILHIYVACVILEISKPVSLVTRSRGEQVVAGLMKKESKKTEKKKEKNMRMTKEEINFIDEIIAKWLRKEENNSRDNWRKYREISKYLSSLEKTIVESGETNDFELNESYKSFIARLLISNIESCNRLINDPNCDYYYRDCSKVDYRIADNILYRFIS